MAELLMNNDVSVLSPKNTVKVYAVHSWGKNWHMNMNMDMLCLILRYLFFWDPWRQLITKFVWHKFLLLFNGKCQFIYRNLYTFYNAIHVLMNWSRWYHSLYCFNQSTWCDYVMILMHHCAKKNNYNISVNSMNSQRN